MINAFFTDYFFYYIYDKKIKATETLFIEIKFP